ncbi:hypothetical protein, membrane [Rhodopirellula maiorica SM1]|uniref:Uncharacterized protein n=1 Tax=Rhodopirellula maiorica SM1 TaxID=1265738 RepID=M5S487_9BACT|nr:hypothetical protein, membrane [Rhodopirellula maiorica SM1]
MLQFEATPDSNGLIFGIHALVFVTLGTLWFHLFGQPALAGRFGNASQQTLARERDRFRAGLP